MPARSWSKGTDHAAQYPRRRRRYHESIVSENANDFCLQCEQPLQHVTPIEVTLWGKYKRCCTNPLCDYADNNEWGSLTLHAPDVCQECGETETIDPNNDGVPVCTFCGTRR